MASKGPLPSQAGCSFLSEYSLQPLPTVLMTVQACLKAAVPEAVLLQLSVEPETSGEFRLTVRKSEAARGLGNTVVAEFKLKDVNYDLRSSKCHELTVFGNPGNSMLFNFEDEREAQKWWTVVSSSLREALKAEQLHGAAARNKPCVQENQILISSSPVKLLPTEVGSPITLIDLSTKEDLALRLGRAIEIGDQQLSTESALALAKLQVPLQIQLKQNNYPKTEICMKVGVEDASGSANISINVQAHTTIAFLKQQMFLEYQFHPNVQRWIIGQCLCSDERTVGSYGIKRDGDTAFLYLLSAKQGKLNIQDPSHSNALFRNSLGMGTSLDGKPKCSTLPNRQTPTNVAVAPKQKNDDERVNIAQLAQVIHREINALNLTSRPTIPPAPPSPAQVGWPCPACTYINKPTRPGCEMCSADRPSTYVIPDKYKPDEVERKRLQQEQESLQQYNKAQEEERLENFLHLLQMDDEVLIPNQEAIECRICYTEVPAGDGVLLRECLHSFCRECLRQVVNCCEDPEVSCPFRDDTYSCNSKLQQREISALVSKEEYSRFLERGLVVAESRSQNSYHCRTADCKGWCIYEDSVNEFICPICLALNCLTCKAIHDGMNCREYQDDLRIRALNDAAARQTNDMLKTLVQTGEAMYCPVCKIVVQKKDGCDWIRCTMCQTEICWVTKGPRWGPMGPGDTSGGCQCNLNGTRCDPRCQNCH